MPTISKTQKLLEMALKIFLGNVQVQKVIDLP